MEDTAMSQKIAKKYGNKKRGFLPGPVSNFSLAQFIFIFLEENEVVGDKFATFFMS